MNKLWKLRLGVELFSMTSCMPKLSYSMKVKRCGSLPIKEVLIFNLFGFRLCLQECDIPCCPVIPAKILDMRKSLDDEDFWS